jgi:hypothetical protein
MKSIGYEKNLELWVHSSEKCPKAPNYGRCQVKEKVWAGIMV